MLWLRGRPVIHDVFEFASLQSAVYCYHREQFEQLSPFGGRDNDRSLPLYGQPLLRCGRVSADHNINQVGL